MKYIVFLFFIISCAVPEQIKNQAVGVGVSQVADKVVEELSPVYDFYAVPIELCYFTDTDEVECVLTNCESNCKKKTTLNALMKESPFVISSQSASFLLNSVKQFCEKNPCEQIVARYSNGKILID